MFEDFVNVERQNEEVEFDYNVYEALKSYVYLLFRRGRVFYVGKGGGNEEGNKRVLEHFDEAEHWLDKRDTQPSPKVLEIAQAWRDGEAIDWFIVRRGLTEPEAFHVEASLIDALALSPNRQTSNLVKGVKVREHGALSSSDIRALAAPPVKPNNAYRRVFVFQIQNAFAARSAKSATEGDWKVSSQNRNANDAIAVGLVQGVSRIVLKVGAWAASPPNPNTFRFEGSELANHELLNKNFTSVISPALGYLQFGGGYVIVEFNANNQFRFHRGSSDRQTWHQL